MQSVNVNSLMQAGLLNHGSIAQSTVNTGSLVWSTDLPWQWHYSVDDGILLDVSQIVLWLDQVYVEHCEVWVVGTGLVSGRLLQPSTGSNIANLPYNTVHCTVAYQVSQFANAHSMGSNHCIIMHRRYPLYLCWHRWSTWWKKQQLPTVSSTHSRMNKSARLRSAMRSNWVRSNPCFTLLHPEGTVTWWVKN